LIVTYEEQILSHLRAFFDDEDHPYIRNVRLDGTSLFVTFFDKHIDQDRDEVIDIYKDGFNTTGRDYPEGVAALIGTFIDEQALAKRKT
jgi:hypothetical protein